MIEFQIKYLNLTFRFNIMIYKILLTIHFFLLIRSEENDNDNQFFDVSFTPIDSKIFIKDFEEYGLYHI